MSVTILGTRSTFKFSAIIVSIGAFLAFNIFGRLGYLGKFSLRSAVIIDGRVSNAILKEILTDKGYGTLIS